MNRESGGGPTRDPIPDGGSVGWGLVHEMQDLTLARISEDSLANVRANQKHLTRGASIRKLPDSGIGARGDALIIASGPSIEKRDPLSTVREVGFDGTIIAADSALYYCLRNGVVPDLVVTLDSHSTRIVRWFGDPNLGRAEMESDDYFRRQDLDSSFSKESETNRNIIRLLEEYGPRIRIALCTSSPKAVVDRVLDVGMEIYWWNALYDDPDEENSITRGVMKSNGLPSINGGGNVGTCCWMISTEVLGKERTILTGMDFSYYIDTPYRNTQYYHPACELVGEENLDSIFISVYNPYLDTWFYTDPAYMWYRNSFLELAGDSSCRIVNCTEGGILFGENVQFMSLADGLRELRR